MLAKRTLVAAVLLPVGIAVILLGGPVYAVVVAIVLGLAAWEYLQLFHAGGLRPAGVFVIGGTFLFAAGRAWDGFTSSAWIASLVILGSLVFHLVAFERGRDQAATDFGVSLGGAFYLGWIGAYLISLRFLPDGLGWVLVALPSVWAADVGAYLMGTRLGRHRFSPRLSPKKTWEGYLGGILFGTLMGLAAGALWPVFAQTETAVTPLRGLLVGLVLATFTPLGDLGESMIKRQVGAKDSGTLLPGHGGMFDRIDSWLWAGVIAYYLVQWLIV